MILVTLALKLGVHTWDLTQICTALTIPRHVLCCTNHTCAGILTGMWTNNFL